MMKVGGGSPYGYCLPAAAPVVARQQAMSCKQTWLANCCGLEYDEGDGRNLHLLTEQVSVLQVSVLHACP